MGSINQSERAYRLWQVLIDLAKHKRQLTYKELGEAIGIHHRAVRFPLHLIQDYCLEVGLPGLTVLAVNQKGERGQGFRSYQTHQINEGIKEVLSFPWHEEENPFAFAASGESYSSFIEKVLDQPEERQEIYTRTKARGVVQQLFREALMEAYRGKCAFSGSNVEETLEAAHIVPWSQCSEADRLNPSNGLLLNAYYHKLYDSGILSVDDTYYICLDSEKERSSLSDFDKYCIEQVVGKRIKLPKHKDYFPNVEFIRWRNGADDT